MIVKGRIYDSVTGLPVAYASVTQADANGSYARSGGVSADAEGKFSIDISTGYILITHVDYKSIHVQVGCCNQIEIPMQTDPDVLQTVTVTAKKNAHWIILAFIGYLALTDN